MKFLVIALFVFSGCTSKEKDPLEVGLIRTQKRLPTEKEKAKALEWQMYLEDLTPMERKRLQS